jgi:hypothetical protein
MSWRE